MKEGATESVAEVLGKIRGKLGAQIRADLDSGKMAAQRDAAAARNASALRPLLAPIQAAQEGVGVVNPRPPGFHNDLIQLVKKGLRRMLSWYIRPIVEYQARTSEFLSLATQILERQQAELRELGERVGALTADLNFLCEQLQMKLDQISPELEKPVKDRT